MQNNVNQLRKFLTSEKKCNELVFDDYKALINSSGLNFDDTKHIYSTEITGLYIVLMNDGGLHSITEDGEVRFSAWISGLNDKNFDYIKKCLNEYLEFGNIITKTKEFLTSEQKCNELVFDDYKALINSSGLNFDDTKHIYSTEITGLYIVLMNDGGLHSITEDGEVRFSEWISGLKNKNFDDIKKFLNECLENGNTITKTKKFLTSEKKCNELVFDDYKALINSSGLNFDDTKHIYSTEITGLYIVLMNDGGLHSITEDGEVRFSEWISGLKDKNFDDIKKCLNEYLNKCLENGNRITKTKEFLRSEQKYVELKRSENKALINSLGLNFDDTKHIYDTKITRSYIALMNNGDLRLIAKDGKVKYEKCIPLRICDFDYIKKALNRDLMRYVSSKINQIKINLQLLKFDLLLQEFNEKNKKINLKDKNAIDQISKLLDNTILLAKNKVRKIFDQKLERKRFEYIIQIIDEYFVRNKLKNSQFLKIYSTYIDNIKKEIDKLDISNQSVNKFINDINNKNDQLNKLFDKIQANLKVEIPFVKKTKDIIDTREIMDIVSKLSDGKKAEFALYIADNFNNKERELLHFEISLIWKERIKLYIKESFKEFLIDDISQNNIPSIKITKSHLSFCDILFFDKSLLISTPTIQSNKKKENKNGIPFERINYNNPFDFILLERILNDFKENEQNQESDFYLKGSSEVHLEVEQTKTKAKYF